MFVEWLHTNVLARDKTQDDSLSGILGEIIKLKIRIAVTEDQPLKRLLMEYEIEYLEGRFERLLAAAQTR